MAKASFLAAVFLLFSSLSCFSISVNCHLEYGYVVAEPTPNVEAVTWIENAKFQTWCVAKPSADDKVLTQILDFACSKVDCSMLKPGESCFFPDNAISHASVAMNFYYAKLGRNAWNCAFNNSGQSYGLITISNPSFDGCRFP